VVGNHIVKQLELRQWRCSVTEKVWTCPICGGVGRVGGSLPGDCKIPEKSIGIECLAMRQLDEAKEFAAKKAAR
jgi:hypothetical protein